MSRWKVQWEMPPTQWAAAHGERRDYRDIWDLIPWQPPTCRETYDEGSAREQYEQLCAWETSKEQPVRNVKLFRASDPDWVPDPSTKEPR